MPAFIPAAKAQALLTWDDANVFTDSLRLNPTLISPDSYISASLLKVGLEEVTPLGNAQSEAGQQIFIARAHFRAAIGIWTKYNVESVFATKNKETSPQIQYLHEVKKLYGNLQYDTTVDFQQNGKGYTDAYFDFDYYQLSGLRANGYSGNVPLNIEWFDRTPQEIILQGETFAFSGASTTATIDSVRIDASFNFDIGQYNDYFQELKSVTYTVVDPNLGSQSQEFTEEMPSFSGQATALNAEPLTTQFLIQGQYGARPGSVLPIKTPKDYNTGETLYTTGQSAPAVGVLAPPSYALIGIILKPDVSVYQQDIIYDMANPIHVGIKGRTYELIDPTPGIYEPFSQTPKGLNARNVINGYDRYIGWAVQNKAQVYELDIIATIYATTNIEGNLEELGAYELPSVYLDDMFWSNYLGGESVQRTLDTSKWYDPVLKWLGDNWWVLAIGIPLFYVAFIMPTQRGLLTGRIQKLVKGG